MLLFLFIAVIVIFSYHCNRINNLKLKMRSFQKLQINRRSARNYKDVPLNSNEIKMIFEAALLSPTSKNRHSWEFIAVEDKEMLTKLSNCKPHSAKFVKDAALAIVVLGNPIISNVWVEDASIAAINMQMQVEELGLGSCWVQVRSRDFSDTITSGDYINDLLEIPMPLEVLCIITVGRKDKSQPPADINNLLWERVHIGKYKMKQLDLE